MFLAPENVPYYLAERGLVSLKSVVDGDFTVFEQSSRNYNLKVVRQGSPGFFIKQVRRQSADLTTSFEREAACYEAARDGDKLAALKRLIPDFHLFDARRHVMVLGLLSGAESLWEHHKRVRRFSPRLAELQGDKLGEYHDGVRVSDLSSPDLTSPALKRFPRALPWILSIHESDPSYLATLSRGNAQVVEILRRFPEFPRALKEIKRSWRHNALIHGDVKWENLMLCGRRESDGAAANENGAPSYDGADLKVIDWEMADIGDDCWDVGAIFQSYLTFWIFSLPLAEKGLAEAAADSPYDEDEMKRAMNAFWHRYAARRRLSSKMYRRMRERSMRCAAARMIQTAFESVQKSPDVTPHALCKLQMAMNILQDPAAAVRDLMKV